MSVSAGEAERGLEQRRRAEESRALAAEHRARAHELRAGVNTGATVSPDGSAEQDGDALDSDAFLHAGIEEVLAEIADLRAAGFDERAAACDALIAADGADDSEREQLKHRAAAAVIRAAELEAQAIALRDELQADPDLHEALSEAAMARARAREQRALALAARPQAGIDEELRAIRAERNEAWAEVHERLALAHQLRGHGLAELAATSQHEVERLRAVAQAADAREAAAEGQLDAA